jgi:hypothetical protein
MKFPDDQTPGADANEHAVRGNKEAEPLFGDERWIEEHLQVLRAQAGYAEQRARA